MSRLFLCLLALALCGVASIRADEDVRATQARLQQGGFYFGKLNGVYDKETAAAVTRYQIRNGLQITGKLDAETTKALGLPTAKTSAPTSKGEDVWRYLRKSDQEYIQQLLAGEAKSNQRERSSAAATASPAVASSEAARGQLAMKTVEPPASSSRERLRDYIAAFVLAGLDPQTGSELEFFADRVEYFGENNVGREKIRRDLVRYDKRWPERRFWLDGELQVEPESNNRLRVTFPLRYELRSRSDRSSGKVLKTLLLEPADNDLQIVAVNERKAR